MTKLKSITLFQLKKNKIQFRIVTKSSPTVNIFQMCGWQSTSFKTRPRWCVLGRSGTNSNHLSSSPAPTSNWDFSSQSLQDNFQSKSTSSSMEGSIILLSRYYSASSQGDIMPTRIVNMDFNDMNQEEPSRYISHAGKCHFLGKILK